MPERIQIKRIKGWKMPENTVYVGRPSKWGNSLKCINGHLYIHAGYRRRISYRRILLDYMVHLALANENTMLELFESFFDKNITTDNPDIIHWHIHFMSLDLSELKGKNLACFCSLNKPCHADVLLRLANK